MVEVLSVVYLVAGLFTVAASTLSAAHIYMHLRENPHKLIRRSIVRILMMVPIYACESWLGLVFQKQAQIFSILRDCYEAFVIYSFFTFLVEYLGGTEHLADTLRSKAQVSHISPFCCLRNWTMGSEFLKYCAVGVLQYVPIKLFMALTTLICALAGVYGDGEFRYDRGYPYVAFITNCSQIWAMYCLILFYVGTREELAPIKPVNKILSIKAIVFFTYWQSVLISALIYFDVISGETFHFCEGTPEKCWDQTELADGLQDFIICIEMLCFAIAHLYVFRVEDFTSGGIVAEENAAKAPLLSKLIDAINVADVAQDVKNSQNPILTRKQLLAAKWDTTNGAEYEET